MRARELGIHGDSAHGGQLLESDGLRRAERVLPEGHSAQTLHVYASNAAEKRTREKNGALFAALLQRASERADPKGEILQRGEVVENDGGRGGKGVVAERKMGERREI